MFGGWEIFECVTVRIPCRVVNFIHVKRRRRRTESVNAMLDLPLLSWIFSSAKDVYEASFEVCRKAKNEEIWR